MNRYKAELHATHLINRSKIIQVIYISEVLILQYSDLSCAFDIANERYEITIDGNHYTKLMSIQLLRDVWELMDRRKINGAIEVMKKTCLRHLHDI